MREVVAQTLTTLEGAGWFEGPGDYGALRRAYTRAKLEALMGFAGDHYGLEPLDRALVEAGIGEHPGVALASVPMYYSDWPGQIQYVEDIEALVANCCVGSFGLLELRSLDVSLDGSRLDRSATVAVEVEGEGFSCSWSLGPEDPGDVYDFWPYMSLVHQCLGQVAPGWRFEEHDVNEPLCIAVLTPPGLDPKPLLPPSFLDVEEDSWGEAW